MLFLKILFSILVFVLVGSASADPWKVHQSNIRVYEKKINRLNDEIVAAIKKKNMNLTPIELKATMKQMIANHGKVAEQIQKRNKELRHMRFRHPEKGQEFERKYYKTYRLKSLQEYEEEVGLPGRLTRIKEKVKSHYGIRTKEEIAADKAKDELKESIEKSIKLVK